MGPVFVGALCVARCLPRESARALAPRLVAIASEGPPAALDALPRSPTLALQFDAPLRRPPPDALWLLRLADPQTALSDARRGTLSSTRAALRVPLDAWLDPADSTRLFVRAREALDPDTALSLVTTVRLQGLDGSSAIDGEAESATPVLRTLRIASSSACAPLARVVFPYRDAVPVRAQRLHVAFDRPVYLDAPYAALVALDAVVPLSVAPACVDPRGGSRCAILGVDTELAPSTRYELTLGGLRDDEGREPQVVPRFVETLAHDDTHPALSTPPAFAPTRCADDELALGPACGQLTNEALLVRVSTTYDGAVLARAGEALSLASTGRTHVLSLQLPASRGTLRAQLRTLSLDGTASDVLDLREIALPDHVVAPRIDEVLARPFGGSSQEFVELVNDHDVPVTVAGLVLSVGALSAPPIPETEPALEPGQRLVIAGSGFDPRGARGSEGADPALPPDARLFRLATARITSGGLVDRGSVISLRNSLGTRVSLFPGDDPAIAPRAGASVHRADPFRAQDDPLAWAYDPDARSTPGAATRPRP